MRKSTWTGMIAKPGHRSLKAKDPARRTEAAHRALRCAAHKIGEAQILIEAASELLSSPAAEAVG